MHDAQDEDCWVLGSEKVQAVPVRERWNWNKRGQAHGHRVFFLHSDDVAFGWHLSALGLQ